MSFSCPPVLILLAVTGAITVQACFIIAPLAFVIAPLAFYIALIVGGILAVWVRERPLAVYSTAVVVAWILAGATDPFASLAGLRSRRYRRGEESNRLACG